MVMSTFAACATEDDYVPGDATDASGDDNGTGNAAGGEGDPNDPWYDWPRDPNGYIIDTLPEDMNFEDPRFYVLSADHQKSHYWAEAEDVAPVAQAIYKRNTTVEERLGITIEWDHQPCSSSGAAQKNAFVARAEADVTAGNEYDCVVSYNLLPYRLANKGLAVNLKDDSNNINLEMPWWPQEFLGNLLYKDQIFALVDNASVGTLTNLSCIFFNNTMLENKGIESPYGLVKSNDWTIPKLKELIKDTYEDVDGDGQRDGGTGGDIFGLCTSTAARITSWYYGAGLHFGNLNENGELTLNTDMANIESTIAAIVDLFSTEDSLVNEPDKQYIMFREERAYFYLSVVSMCTDMVNNNISIDYGVAPNPKLNSDQSRYYTHVPNTHEAWYLIKGTKDLDCSTAFIEAMASEAYRQVNAVFFEDTIKLRYAPGEELADMYDLIRESITFDFVYVWKDVIGGDIDTGIRKCIQTPESNNWASTWKSVEGKVTTNFQTILDAYEMNAQ